MSARPEARWLRPREAHCTDRRRRIFYGSGGRGMRVLVVEDEIPLADAVARGLRRLGMNVDVAYDGIEGFGKAIFAGYDVLVLDRDLPGMPGDEICRAVTARTATRVLMVTANTSDAARAAGFELGA